jgi:hypothetical protein
MSFTEQDHLAGKDPIVPLIFKKLIKEVQKFGVVRVDPKKTSIHLVNRTSFAGLYVRKSCINLEVHLNHKIKNKRIQKAEQASANRYHHTIQVNSPAEVDEELLGWLKEAFDLKA